MLVQVTDREHIKELDVLWPICVMNGRQVTEISVDTINNSIFPTAISEMSTGRRDKYIFNLTETSTDESILP